MTILYLFLVFGVLYATFARTSKDTIYGVAIASVSLVPVIFGN